MRKVAGAAAAAAASLTLSLSILALTAMTSGCSQQDGGAAPAGKLASNGAPHPGAVAAQPNAAQPGKAGAAAHKAGDKPLWRSLTPAQQVALQPLAGEWDQMDGVRKQKWLQLASRFSTMKPEEQERVHARMREWVKLTPEQRELARETYNRTRKIAPEQKTATWESYLQLPDDQKKKLAASVAGRKAPAPSQAGAKDVARLGHGAGSCPAGMVRNSVSAAPPCVAVPAPVVAPPAPQQPAPLTPPATPVAPPPPPPEKQEPANWGITPNNA